MWLLANSHTGALARNKVKGFYSIFKYADFALRVSSVTRPHRWTWTVTTTCCQALLLSYQPTAD